MRSSPTTRLMCWPYKRALSYLRRDKLKKSFQIFLGLFGVIAILIASLHIFFGPSAIPGSVPVNPTMDSEDRFYATLFAAFGVALIWCIKDIEKKAREVYFLTATFFIGGLARVVSISQVGLPNLFFIAMTILELVIPVYMAYAQYQIVREANARSSGKLGTVY